LGPVFGFESSIQQLFHSIDEGVISYRSAGSLVLFRTVPYPSPGHQWIEILSRVIYYCQQWFGLNKKVIFAFNMSTGTAPI
jgi:hypothetical protein